MNIDTMKAEIVLAEKGMTKGELSAKSGISRQNLSAILKRGVCTPKTAGKLAAGLGVPVADIMEARV